MKPITNHNLILILNMLNATWHRFPSQRNLFDSIDSTKMKSLQKFKTFHNHRPHTLFHLSLYWTVKASRITTQSHHMTVEWTFYSSLTWSTFNFHPLGDLLLILLNANNFKVNSRYKPIFSFSRSLGEKPLHRIPYINRNSKNVSFSDANTFFSCTSLPHLHHNKLFNAIENISLFLNRVLSHKCQ